MSAPADRFKRQAGLVPRSRLAQAEVSVIGAGAIGRQCAIQLAAIGVPSLQLIDFDTVEATNVTTQGYKAGDIGLPKVLALERELRRIDGNVKVTGIQDRFRPKYQVREIVFCCVDSISARAAIWRSAGKHAALWIDGRMLGEVMRILIAWSEQSAAHYESTLFDPADAQRGVCTSRSTIYTGSIAAGLMIHQLTRWLRELPLDQDVTCNLLASELVAQ